MTKAVIVYLLKEDAVCLGMKKRRHGVGKWNGFGGKGEDETYKQTAVRELMEEAQVKVNQSELISIGDITFLEPDTKWRVKVFIASSWQGQPQETEEMRPQWFNFDQIPYAEMWSDDKHWFDNVLKRRPFKAKFWLDGDGKTTKHQVQQV